MACKWQSDSSSINWLEWPLFLFLWLVQSWLLSWQSFILKPTFSQPLYHHNITPLHHRVEPINVTLWTNFWKMYQSFSARVIFNVWICNKWSERDIKPPPYLISKQWFKELIPQLFLKRQRSYFKEKFRLFKSASNAAKKFY